MGEVKKINQKKIQKVQLEKIKPDLHQEGHVRVMCTPVSYTHLDVYKRQL